MSVFNLKVHEEIARWRQEAKDEDNAKYFFPVPEVELLRSGERSFLISRKGTGKTAIGQNILKQKTADAFATALSFKNFPFNDLYRSLRDNSFRQPNQYISGWRFIIYCAIARLMSANAAVDPGKRRFIKSLFASDLREALPSTIGRWISGGFHFKFWEIGLGVKAARQFTDNQRSLAERAEVLKQFLLPSIGKSQYFVVFDELDEDYTSSASTQEREEYFALLTSLLKAVQLIREEFRESAPGVRPIVLLRDDIFKQLSDSDRAKWTDNAVVISWDIDKIKNLLAFRLSRAAGVDPVMRFDEIWRDLVGRHETFTPNTKEWNKFDFIASYTLLRPRDFIYYVSDASRHVCEKIRVGVAHPGLSAEVLRECAREFAQHLKMELEDEVGGQIPYIKDVMDMILSFGERDFSFAEFQSAYAKGRSEARHTPWTLPAESVLNSLYLFSVIGFVRTSKEYYRYQNPTVDLDVGRTMLVHKGLFAARKAN